MSDNPKLGATFYPGGLDDFYMPEVISPSPQRVMPEVPEKIQEDLANLELNAKKDGGSQRSLPHGSKDPSQSMAPSSHSRTVSNSRGAASGEYFPPRKSSISAGAPSDTYPRNDSYGSHQSYSQAPPQQAQTSYSQPNSALQPHSASTDYGYSPSSVYSPYDTVIDQPSFSPFPRIPDRPHNIPPSDDEKEALLDRARPGVLSSNDPDMQLSWAEDALKWVEISEAHEERVSQNTGGRPHTPQVEHQLRVDAMNVVNFLAEQHHPKAEFIRGTWLEFGMFGFRVDRKEAYRCYSRAAERGFARAEYRMGMQYESSNEPMKAIKHYNQGASMGDSASNYRLGMMTLLGQHSQKQDYARGVHLIRLSAQNADANAPQGAYVYGMLQAHELPGFSIPELFLPVDINGARSNIEKGALLGFAKAQLKMGSAYELCQLGCDFNPVYSLHYNALAAKQGEAEADMAISKWFLCGQDNMCEKNEKLAFEYAQRAAQSGLPTAEFAMGYFYEIGIAIPQDLREARTWYEKAAEHGNKDATGRLESLAQSQTLTKKDHENVAIARIKSMHGSQRGKRPERFKATPSLPTINDDRIDMPDPAKVSPALSSYNSPQMSPPMPDGRQSYLNPMLQQIPARPASAAPYPVENDIGPGARPGTAAGFFNPNIRPSSAFNVRLDQRPVSLADAPPAGGNYYPHTAGPIRPAGTPAPYPDAGPRLSGKPAPYPESRPRPYGDAGGRGRGGQVAPGPVQYGRYDAGPEQGPPGGRGRGMSPPGGRPQLEPAGPPLPGLT
jgi:TPR repeat protein